MIQFCGRGTKVDNNFIGDKCGVVYDFYGSANEIHIQINDVSTDYIAAIIHQFGELNSEVADFTLLVGALLV